MRFSYFNHYVNIGFNDLPVNIIYMTLYSNNYNQSERLKRDMYFELKHPIIHYIE